QKERAQELRRLCGVCFVALEIICEGERLNGRLHAIEICRVSNLSDLRIAFPVATNVRETVGLRGVWPEVRRLAHVVMHVTARWRHSFVDDRKRTFMQGFVGIALQFCPSGI